MATAFDNIDFSSSEEKAFAAFLVAQCENETRKRILRRRTLEHTKYITSKQASVEQAEQSKYAIAMTMMIDSDSIYSYNREAIQYIQYG